MIHDGASRSEPSHRRRSSDLLKSRRKSDFLCGSQFDVESIRGVRLVLVQGVTSPKLARTTYALLENDCSKVRACASLVLDARSDSRSCCLKERVNDLQRAVIGLYQTQIAFALRVLTYTC